VPPVIRPVPASERDAALRLSLFTPQQSAQDLAQQIESLRRFMSGVPVDCVRQWGAYADSELLTACTALQSPGEVAYLLIPGNLVSACGFACARDLLRALCESASAMRPRWLHCLLQPHDTAALTELLEGHQFSRLARLAYMLLSPMPTPSREDRALAGRLRWTPYSPAQHARFVEAVRRTYEGSLDCPALTPLRSAEEAIAGHKSAGVFAAHRWLLVEGDRSPQGCLLLNEVHGQAILEIAYMGLSLESRGKGLGRALIARAIQTAREDGFAALMLAVDESNASAVRLYERAGFRAMLERDAWIRVLSVGRER